MPMPPSAVNNFDADDDSDSGNFFSADSDAEAGISFYRFRCRSQLNATVIAFLSSADLSHRADCWVNQMLLNGRLFLLHNSFNFEGKKSNLLLQERKSPYYTYINSVIFQTDQIPIKAVRRKKNVPC